MLFSIFQSMNLPDQPHPTSRILLAAALHGALAWCSYAIIEVFASGLWPLIIGPDTTLMPWFWQGTAVLFGAYAAAGAGFGLLGGLILAAFPRRYPPRSLSAMAVGTLALALSANLLLQPEVPRSDLLGAGLGLLVALNSGLVIWSAWWERRFGYLGGPFTASLLVLTAPWLHRTLFPPDTPWTGSGGLPPTALFKWAAVSAAVLVIVVTAKIGSRWRATAVQGLFPQALFLGAFTSLALLGGTLGVVLSRNAPPDVPLPPGESSPRPNVLFISLDTVRADHMSLYGYARPTTPRLQAFAQDASVYNHAVSVADMTLASHASMFTGMYPRRHGAHYQPDQPFGRAMPDVPTLAETLSSRGYASRGVVANYAYLHPLFGFRRGFQTYDYRSPVQLFDPNGTFYLRRVVRSAADWVVPMEQFDRLCRSAGEINHEVFPMLEKFAQRKRPFFLFLNYMDVHAPRMPPAEFKDRFPGRDPHLTSQKYYAIVKDVMRQKRALLPRERESAIALYDGSLAYLDDQIGQLIDRLKTLGIYENTMIVITSDHGEAFGERDLMEHSVSVYQDQISVPLLIKFPNTHAARQLEETVSHVDLLPTILNAVGLPVPEGMQGLDLRGMNGAGSRNVISESFRNAMFVDWNRRFNRTETSMVSGRMKLIVSTAGKRELYDLAVDPQERTNLATTADAGADIERQLAAWMKSVTPKARAIGNAGDINLQRLKSLGYAQ